MASEGRIELVTGPMWSGKTTELIRRLRRYTHAGRDVVVIKAACDLRYDNDDLVSTHDKTTMPAVSANALLDVADNHYVKSADVIGIDEGHFFPDLAVVCNLWADAGRIVIVAGLDTDYQREPFESMINLGPDTIDKLSSICKACKGEASFTMRITNDTQVNMVGGDESYVPVCRACYVNALLSMGTS